MLKRTISVRRPSRVSTTNIWWRGGGGEGGGLNICLLWASKELEHSQYMSWMNIIWGMFVLNSCLFWVFKRLVSVGRPFWTFTTYVWLCICFGSFLNHLQNLWLFWVLTGTSSVRRFFWAPTTYVGWVVLYFPFFLLCIFTTCIGIAR